MRFLGISLGVLENSYVFGRVYFGFLKFSLMSLGSSHSFVGCPCILEVSSLLYGVFLDLCAFLGSSCVFFGSPQGCKGHLMIFWCLLVIFCVFLCFGERGFLVVFGGVSLIFWSYYAFFWGVGHDLGGLLMVYEASL